MKNECKIVSDLLSLYSENLVCEETENFIKNHLSECEECKKDFELLKADTEINEAFQKVTENQTENIKPLKKIMKKMNMQLHSISYLLIVFFIFFGFLSIDSSDVFYNSLIMPIVGVFGYIIFKFRAFYKLPILLLIINISAGFFKVSDIQLADIFFWTAIFTLFVFIGILIAFLLHFAFRKDNEL